MPGPTALNVVVDGLAHLGPLSYLAPVEETIRPGDAVQVPVGKRIATGLVIGPGSPTKATREILKRYGERTTTPDLTAAQHVATEQATQLQQVTARLAPRTGKGATPSLVADTVATVELPDIRMEPEPSHAATVLLHEPGVLPEDLAAKLATTLTADGGQVLILCPTTTLVERVLSRFTAGEVRLDSRARPGDWAAFREGHAPVGVGTRAAAWYAPARLAGIVVLEEQNEGHREQRAPRHHTRDVALSRAKAASVPVIFTSMNPTPAALGSGARLCHVTRADGLGWPTMRLYDETKDTVSSDDLPFQVQAELEQEAKTTQPLVVVGGRATRRCMGCFSERAKPVDTGDRCIECGEVHTRVLGYDKERIDALFDGTVTPVLPTELSRYTNSGLVVITDLTTALTRPALNPYQHAVDLILNAASTAGPRGEVVAVVRDTTHPVLRLLFEARDQVGIVERSYRTAQRLKLPPFGRLVHLDLLQQKLPDMRSWPGHVHGPTPGKGGWRFLVRCAHDDLPAVRRELGKFRRAKVRFRYHID